MSENLVKLVYKFDISNFIFAKQNSFDFYCTIYGGFKQIFKGYINQLSFIG